MKKLIYQIIFTAIALLTLSGGYAQGDGPRTIITESIIVFSKTKISYELIGTSKRLREDYINKEDDYTVGYELVFNNENATTLSNVVIRDELSKFLDANSIEVKASHSDYGLQILDDNVLEFRFDHIDLPKGGTKVLRFELQVYPTAQAESIVNKASIYVDDKLSGHTNEVIYKFTGAYEEINSTGIDYELNRKKASISPNPTMDIIRIRNIDSGYVKLVNDAGKVLLSTSIIPDQELNLANYPSGMYTLIIENQLGKVETHRLLKIQ